MYSPYKLAAYRHCIFEAQLAANRAREKGADVRYWSSSAHAWLVKAHFVRMRLIYRLQPFKNDGPEKFITMSDALNGYFKVELPNGLYRKLKSFESASHAALLFAKNIDFRIQWTEPRI